ncbi:hypothetical protein [Larkinella punicea]|uniref:hypothetical protein n=1 Tax=Larkinella punicea TaxID=2315727 RepID=UPI00140210D9|nr:hypothetical protein [Larkinella punicea]
MKTKGQSIDDQVEPVINRIRKDGKPLFAEKLERVNAVLKKSGLPKLPPKE